MATVKGDIHDIGKNIVKVLLDNYGYTVVDLGRDVDPQLIVDTAVEQNITMIGLSALMTTTLKSMEDTIRLVRECKELQNPDGSSKCTIFVGGAVLTKDYAMKSVLTTTAVTQKKALTRQSSFSADLVTYIVKCLLNVRPACDKWWKDDFVITAFCGKDELYARII